MALSIQERIKDLRLDRGLTLKQLAEQDCSLSAYKVFLTSNGRYLFYICNPKKYVPQGTVKKAKNTGPNGSNGS